MMLHTLFLSFWLRILVLFPHTAQGEQIPITSPARLRNATPDDADAITNIYLAAFAPLPAWQYLYPFRHDFPEDHKRCYLKYVNRMLSEASAHTEVIESPTGSDAALIAAAIWVRHDSQDLYDVYRRSSECMHKDVNVTRALDYQSKFEAAKLKHVDNVFGTDQLYLHQLATDPKYQGRGAGSHLILSGLERGRKARVNVTLIAEPTAETFYLHRGFREMKNISIESVDGDGDFRYNIMAYDLRGQHQNDQHRH